MKSLWGFFFILLLSTAFLKKSIESWEDEDSFAWAKEIVDNLAVVNDSACRAGFETLP